MSNNIKIEEADFDIIEKFIYWTTHSFSGDINGGMSKVNSHIGLLNRLKKPKIQEKITKIKVYNKSYDEIIDKYDKKDSFFYVDPPYFGREYFYGFHPFQVDDHYKLSKILYNIKNDFVLSYYETPEIKEIYPENKFRWERKEYKRSSSSVKKGVKKEIATEVLIMKQKDILDLIFK
jgi:site-specific DNA-adenine methylase